MYLVSKLSTVLFLLLPFGIIDEQTICSALTLVLKIDLEEVENQLLQPSVIQVLSKGCTLSLVSEGRACLIHRNLMTRF